MLKIFNDLEPFFRDSYRRISVREFARLVKISPPSASTLLNGYEKEGLLIREDDRRYNFFAANKNSRLFIQLCRLFWSSQFKNVGLIEHLERKLTNPLIILFGSFSKAEIIKNSDIDMAVFAQSGKRINPIDVSICEEKLKRNIHILVFRTREELKNKELLNNILNGFIISGSW